MSLYNEALASFAKGEIAWLTDQINVTLHTSGYTPNLDTHQFFSDVTNELSGGGYTSGGYILATKTVTSDTTNDRVELSAANTVITGFTGTFRYIIVRKFNATASASRLISVIDLGSDQNFTNETCTLTWNAEGIVQLRRG